MNIKQSSALRAGLLVCSAFVGFWPSLASSQVAAKPADATAKVAAADEETIKFNPFVVSTDKDSGWTATNTISGSRVNTAIKDLPIPIQVITKEFIRDIGATDLRSSLAYSSSIQLKTQNDMENTGGGGYQPSAYGAGGVNNPEGLTANPNQVQLKIRGFVTNNVLRDGFLRASSTDTVNLDRVEVVSGPNSLLYGTGNFGGVVDYLTKQPQSKQQGTMDFSYGTNNFKRVQLDVTGPISVSNHLDYRLGGAIEDTDTHIDDQKLYHWMLAPSVSWKPTETTVLLFDTELSSSAQKGFGFQAMRAAIGTGGTPINNDQIESIAFFFPTGADPRTFNLSGPDTFNKQQVSNIEVKLTQELVRESDSFPEVNLLIGYNHNNTSMQAQYVDGQITGPIALGQPGYGVSSTVVTTVLANSLGGLGSNNGNLTFGTFPHSVGKYSWGQTNSDTTRDQERLELTARKVLFSGKWYHLDDQVLAGVSQIKNVDNSNSYITDKSGIGGYSYIDPNKLTPIVFGKQGDGSADPALFQNDVNNINVGWDNGLYLNNYLKMIDLGGVPNRLILMNGIRRDKIDKFTSDTSIASPGGTPSTASGSASQITVKSYQNGISLAITKSLSIYGLKAQGIQPNFNGLHDATNGGPVGVDTAKSDEIGIKFDLLEGKLSGTISHYKITKTAFVQAPWFTPTTMPHNGKLRFDPSKDIIYSLSDFNANSSPGSTTSYPVGSAGDYSATQRAPSTVAAWNQANASGAIYLQGGKLYVNASKPDGAAYLDAAFAANQASGGDWPGWLYDETDPLTNNATLDAAGFLNTPLKAATQIVDQSSGWAGEIQYSPNANWQFYFSAAIDTEVKRLKQGNYVKYPYPQDKWAVWYFQNGSFGLQGVPLAQAYKDPADTSTHISSIFPGDDTPKNAFDFVTNYKFDGRLKGLHAGFGLQWNSKREFFSGITHGSGQAEFDATGKLLVLYTPSKLNVNLFARYEFKRASLNQYVQLNVDNAFNDKKLYGLVYNQPMTAKITYGFGF
jgi:iron complex outermembrane receptor protein